MNDNREVAIIGAGIAGSSLAKALADRGWDTVLFDRKPFPRHKVCGEFLSPESQLMLQLLGLDGPVASLQPSRIHRTRLVLGGGDAIEIPLPGTALGVSRYLLDSALLSAAIDAGVHVQAATAVTSVCPNESGYTIETKQGDVRNAYHVRAVIAAWGANGRAGLSSAQRQRPNSEADPTYIGVKSHFSGIDMEPVVELYFFEGGYVGVSPIEGGLVNVAALLERKSFRNNEKTIAGWIDAARRRNAKLDRRLANAVPVPGTQAAVAPVDLSRKPLAWGSLPHVGDAALMIPPLCGDGMSMALRSALLCAPLADRYLSGKISLARWQHEYVRSIRREFHGPMQWGRLLHSLLGMPMAPRLLLGAVRLVPGLAYELMKATRLKPIDS
ncbi:NAD(P)/FAD-dependent oxidoreductase [Paenibacillus allorhizosphaerae]|uniref:tRNA 5-methylaminomethyl-2-thiouridine biosynthesis bifunctional protein MnmC n=1 Tax=Paenibacillus allorhizosphaerae TaxID=2849866 RepID=A0ABM8VM05_9BACL|nr:NAD(P)/FAD-dependent oxidoreductase [Paenibacillus allorhizosphaerae]CAG7649149.1 tRNA 5-methylaminomethyl-2-thiouridine biosynthesis bifunctional protein MnmC [Paenibacillus allorhizosphaerae]